MEFHLAALSNPQVFEGLDPDKYSENGKVRKLQSSSELISKIKSQLIAERVGPAPAFTRKRKC